MTKDRGPKNSRNLDPFSLVQTYNLLQTIHALPRNVLVKDDKTQEVGEGELIGNRKKYRRFLMVISVEHVSV